jgi:hypothetical protein
MFLLHKRTFIIFMSDNTGVFSNRQYFSWLKLSSWNIAIGIATGYGPDDREFRV